MIPKSVVVKRRKYHVRVTQPQRFKKALGYIDYTPGVIYVHTSPAKQMQETFWHELTHAVLYEMGHPLYRNETFVTEFSKLLNRAIHTAKL